MPSRLSEILKIQSLGAKRVKVIHGELGITTLKELEKAAKDEKIQQLPGLGKKTEESIIEEIERTKGTERRTKLSVADEIAVPLMDYLRKAKGIKDITVAGSYRRRKETVGDLDILVTHKQDSKVMEHFVEYEDTQKVVSKGKTRSSILLRSGFQVDLRAVPKASYGATLLYFTGSKPHNLKIRRIANDMGFKINEYGVFKNGNRVAGKTEREVYKKIGLPLLSGISAKF